MMMINTISMQAWFVRDADIQLTYERSKGRVPEPCRLKYRPKATRGLVTLTLHCRYEEHAVLNVLEQINEPFPRTVYFRKRNLDS